MSGSFMGGPFGGTGPGSGGSGMGQGLWDALDQLKTLFEQKVGGPAPRMARGDVRQTVLALLLEQPMHGYQIIAEIEQRSGGTWKPSAGSVYPTLQLLADEGAIVAEESNGRKTYALTESGRLEAEAAAESGMPWASEQTRERRSHSALPKAGVELAQAAAQVGRTGSAEQIEQAVAILEEARRKLYGILAQD